MSHILVVHHDKPTCEFIKVLAGDHDVQVAEDVKVAVRLILANPPDCILIGQESQHQMATQLLGWLQRNVLKIPTIAIIARGGTASHPALLKLGVAGLLEMPINRQRLNDQIAAALAKAKQAAAGPPPITDEELDGNLSLLESALNRRMKCSAGQNQVFIQATLLGGATTRPRICLKCGVRAEFGLHREVYYCFIRDICCVDPDKCEAWRKFLATRDIA